MGTPGNENRAERRWEGQNKSASSLSSCVHWIGVIEFRLFHGPHAVVNVSIDTDDARFDLEKVLSFFLLYSSSSFVIQILYIIKRIQAMTSSWK